MRNLVPALLVISLLLSACASTADETAVSYPNPSEQNTSYPNPSNNDTFPPPPSNEFSPQPDDAALDRVEVYLDTSDVLTLESFPLQFMLHLAGNLPTPCNALRVVAYPPDAENKINVDVYSLSDPDRMCTQVLQPFDVNIPLGSFPEGKYSIWVNGEMIAEIQA